MVVSEQSINLTTLFLGGLRPKRLTSTKLRVSNPGPLAFRPDALPIALHGPANIATAQKCFWQMKNQLF